MFAEPETYDQIITMFSPDGRLLQVEYAVEAVNRGATVLGVSCPEGVVLGAEMGIRTDLQGLDFARASSAVWTKLETGCSPLTRVVPTGLIELLRWATDAK